MTPPIPLQLTKNMFEEKIVPTLPILHNPYLLTKVSKRLAFIQQTYAYLIFFINFTVHIELCLLKSNCIYYIKQKHLRSKEPFT